MSATTLTIALPQCHHCGGILHFWWRAPSTEIEGMIYRAAATHPDSVKAYNDTCCLNCYTERAGWFRLKAEGGNPPPPGEMVQLIDEFGPTDLGYYDGQNYWCWQGMGQFTPPYGRVIWWRTLTLEAPPLEK